MNDLAERLRDQAGLCRSYGSRLTGALLEGAARDLEAGGVVAELLLPHSHEPRGSALSLRYAGSLHHLVLTGQAPELARHYPSAGGSAPVEDVWPAAEAATRQHLAALRSLIRNPVQTNEVGRSAVLYGIMLLFGEPLRLLEIGSSAGLNLRCDRFAYEVGSHVYGEASSPVRLVQPWVGSCPPYRGEPEVLTRKGCDPNPLDPTSDEGRLALRSYVWGDQVERLARLDGAIEVAARVPAVVERAGALEFLRRELARPSDGLTLVWHSVVWQYVDPAERHAVDELLGRTGGNVVRASMEPEKVGDVWVFRVRLQRPGGAAVHVADCLGHGPPVTWTGATLDL